MRSDVVNDVSISAIYPQTDDPKGLWFRGIMRFSLVVAVVRRRE
jgi:hypothetical protein